MDLPAPCRGQNAVLEADALQDQGPGEHDFGRHASRRDAIPAVLLSPDLFVIDLIYNPPVTQLLKDATSARRQPRSAASLMLSSRECGRSSWWTGKPAPVEVMQAELDRTREHGLRRIAVDNGRPVPAPRPVTARPPRYVAPQPRRRRRVAVRWAALRFLTAGESHGPALSATIKASPAGLPLTADEIAVDLARRQSGYGRGARSPRSSKRAEILAGVRHGLTLGSPICCSDP